MKATELMIGDWVMSGREPQYPMKIDWISKDYLDGASEFCYSEDEEVAKVIPIPLTAEILEKNGFWYGLTTEQEDIMECGLGVPVTPQKSWVWENEDDAVVCVDFPNENDGGQVWCNNHEKTSTVVWKNNFSVHELQHALRLCGLNELADNFKI